MLQHWCRCGSAPVPNRFYLFFSDSFSISEGVGDMDLDPDSLRLTGALPVVVPAGPGRRSPVQHYLGGKPPMAWLSLAHKAGKAALATGAALWFKRGLQGGKNVPIRVDSSLRRSMGLTPDQARRGVHALERAGLLEVRRGGRGRCAEVTIVTDNAKPGVAPA